MENIKICIKRDRCASAFVVVEPEIKSFPDGTQNISVPYFSLNIGKNYWYIIEWHYQKESDIFAVYSIVRYLQDCGESNIVLDMPYLPNARMDRREMKTDVLTLKYFCELINSLNLKQVRVLDVHSNVSAALLNNVYIESPKSYIEKVIKQLGGRDNIVLFFPDEGAMKRYKKLFNLPYAFGSKTRDWATGKIKGIEIHNAEALIGKTILMVDDICSKGGTFYHSANAIYEQVKDYKGIYLFVTHCENTVVEGDMIKSGLINHIYTTNSIYSLNHPAITVVDEV